MRTARVQILVGLRMVGIEIWTYHLPICRHVWGADIEIMFNLLHSYTTVRRWQVEITILTTLRSRVGYRILPPIHQSDGLRRMCTFPISHVHYHHYPHRPRRTGVFRISVYSHHSRLTADLRQRCLFPSANVYCHHYVFPAESLFRGSISSILSSARRDLQVTVAERCSSEMERSSSCQNARSRNGGFVPFQRSRWAISLGKMSSRQ